MSIKSKIIRKARKSKPVVPPWMKASWKTAGRKSLKKYTTRDIDAVISEMRAEEQRRADGPLRQRAANFSAC